MIREICGITPEEWVLRLKISAYRPSATTPSWMRAPPESLIPIIGQPVVSAWSMTLTIFSPNTSPSEPPATVKSWEKIATGRPSTVPWPVTTPSPYGRFFSTPKPCARWRAISSNSTKDPSSRKASIRSRAVILPLACCFSTARSDPACTAS
jgi:hypothetical protein